MARKKHVEVFEGRGKKPYRYRVIAGNGEVIASSQGYTRRADAVRGAKRNHPGLPVVVR